MFGKNFYSRLTENMFIWVIYRLIWMIAIEKNLEIDKTLKLVPESRLK